MRVRELMTQSVKACAPTTPVTEIAKDMQRLDVGALPVVENDRVVGIVTDRDIVVECIARGTDPKTVTAKTCMTANPVTVTADTDANEAARTMAEHKIRRLPVIENGRLAGMLSLGDLATVSIHMDEAGDALEDISQSNPVH